MRVLKKNLNIIINLIIILFLIMPILLEYLCKTKMGVYRYIIGKSIKFEKLIYPEFILLLKIIFIIAIISSIV
ncbi:hypothetical protein, partial [Clostridium tarantellae]|uniref:hypothetical protein n=1 Tax=Clostridium tarantellae TaxID=39493 RepID=UPI001A9B9A52